MNDADERADRMQPYKSAGIQDVDLDDQIVVGMIRPLYEAREQEKSSKAANERLTALIKDWLQKRGELYVTDGESGLEAKLQTRGGGAFDLQNIPDELILKLHKLNLLSVNKGGLDRQPEGSEARHRMKAFWVPGETTALLVERAKK